MKEQWRNIQGYEGVYQVSTLGRVRSTDRIVKRKSGSDIKYSGRIRKTSIAKNGYHCLHLYKNNIHHNVMVHRLVAETFIENPQCLLEVNHIDEVKTNNCVDNLEWCTRWQNIHHGNGIKKMAATKSKPVLQYNKQSGLIAIYPSLREAERQTGNQCGNIARVCKGLAMVCGGYDWKYQTKKV